MIKKIDNNFIELLSTDLLDNNLLVSKLNKLSKKLEVQLGWHYLLDLPWAIAQIGDPSGLRILDAGAGVGLMQWYLAGKGADVISVDRGDRRNLSGRFRCEYAVDGFRPGDLLQPNRFNWRALIPPKNPLRWLGYGAKLRVEIGSNRVVKYASESGSGIVRIYNQDISSMPEIESGSIDVVVSISALEHNQPEELPKCLDELMRILKPGGKLVVTMAAAKKEDWFHRPSNGWCYTEQSLRDMFDLGDCESNFGDYDCVFESIRHCNFLRDNLAKSYFSSGKNGMPWGKWDPQYQPMGIVKVKPSGAL